jgi:enoyl-CoA hydratase/carnithine racemase
VTVRVEARGDVGVVTLDWPESRNALDLPRLREVIDAFAAVRASGAGAVVLTGNGAFCSGGNLGAIAERTVVSAAVHRDQIATHAQGLVRAIVEHPVPVIAAVDGPAIGLGFDLALACDDRLVGPGGWFQQGWGRVGLLPGAGGALLLRRLHPTLLWRLLATQPRIAGADAERWGLGEAVDAGTALEVAVERAAALCRLSRDVLELYVSLHRTDLWRDLPAHLDVCAREQGRLLADPALAERIAASRAT